MVIRLLTWVGAGVLLLASACATSDAPTPTTPETTPAGTDPFGITMVHPTRPGGREWFLNVSEPRRDGVFTTSPGDLALTRNADGSWHCGRETSGANSGVRLNVTTPSGQVEWRDIEMTGYVRLTSFSFAEEFAWRTTSGFPHSGPCDGYAYYALLRYDGASASWSKEVWHNNGYVNGPDSATRPTTPLQGRWVGIKAVRYNINNNSQVRLELWIDGNADGSWRKVVESTDTGWRTPNAFPEGSVCANPVTGQPKTLDVIMTWPYPMVSFRADNASFDFRDLSVREIRPPTP